MEIFFEEPEFTGWYSDSALNSNFDVRFVGDGWYSKGSDTLLIIERLGKYKVWVWVNTDPREEFEKVLDLPERKD